jgi:ribosomal protein L18E
VSMSSLARIQTNSGLLDFRASGLITLSRITTQSGNIYLESTSDSVRRLSGFSGANIISLSRSTVNVAKIAEFTVDSSSVLVNGVLVFRGSNQTYIFIAANFS